jgi:hypothetical protein
MRRRHDSQFALVCTLFWLSMWLLKYKVLHTGHDTYEKNHQHERFSLEPEIQEKGFKTYRLNKR